MTEIDAILRRYPRQTPREQITSVSRHAGFSGASVWKIQTAQQAWALRRWPERGLSVRRLAGLHRLLEHVQRAGIAEIAVPVPEESGRTLVTFQGASWQLEPWLPGTADFHRHPSSQRLSATMTLLARWHQAAATFLPAAEHREWFASSSAPSPAIRERLVKLRSWSPAQFQRARQSLSLMTDAGLRQMCHDLLEHLPASLPRIQAELALLEAVSFPLQPCLRDIWHDHVLFVADEVTGLIDASACRTENVAADLARLIGSLAEDDQERWTLALAEYRRQRPVTLAEETLMIALDRSGVVLSALTWINWLLLERRSFSDHQAVASRLTHLQRRLDFLSRRESP